MGFLPTLLVRPGRRTVGYRPAIPALLLAWVLCPASANATVRTVSPPGGGGQFNQIQAAINASAATDIVSVMPGTYAEILTMKNGVAVVAAGTGVIVDGTGIGSDATALVTFSALTNSAVLEGFEIRDYSRGQFPGGGVEIKNGGGILRNCKVTTNLAPRGGGVALMNATGLLEGNTINGNSAQWGCGVYVQGGSPGLINNLIYDNAGCRKGGGIYLQDASAEITNNVINGNRAGNTDRQGAGIYVECISSAGVPLITHNLMTSNNFEGLSSGEGSGIYMETDCTTWGFAYNGFYGNFPSTSVLAGALSNSMLTDPGTTHQTGNPLYVDSADTNIDGDPYDFRLQAGSPMIDAGNPFGGIEAVDLNDGGVDFLDYPTVDDAGGILRPQGGPVPDEARNLRFPDILQPTRQEWNPVDGTSLRYNVYRGQLAQLDGQFYGACETEAEILAGGTTADTVLLDALTPAIGQGFFYLITGEEHISCTHDLGAYEFNGESILGRNSSNQVLPNLNACQLTCSDYF